MTSEGRIVLYRVGLHCAEEWGVALARMEQPESPPGLCTQPFESIAWHDAIQICECLRRGFSVQRQFRS
jgi:hypothetical protein